MVVKKGQWWSMVVYGVMFCAESLRAGETLNPQGKVALPVDSKIEESMSIWEQDTLTGNWGGARDLLADHGVAISPVYTGEVLGNPIGGLGKGAIYEGLINFALDVDLTKLAQWEHGGKLHSNFLYVHGGGQGGGLSSGWIGDLNNTSGIAAYNTPRLQELWFDQPVWGDKADLKVGLISVDTEFYSSSSAGLFINANFGAPTLLGNNLTNPPIYPMAAGGLRLFVHPLPQFTWQAGVFTGDSGAQNSSTGVRVNPNGLDLYWNNGALVMNELAFLLNQQANDQGLPGTYKVGAFVHTGHYNSLDSQTANTLQGTPLEDAGPDFCVYGIVDQTLYKQGVQNISLFTRGGFSPADINKVTASIDGGCNLTGFIPGRDNDVAGIAFSHSWIGDHFSDNQTLSGASMVAYGSESEIEITYKVQVAPWWSIQPDVQYVLTPGGLQTASDALVMGLRSTIAF